MPAPHKRLYDIVYCNGRLGLISLVFIMRLNYDERQSLTMNEISQYHRVSTESDDDENDEELGRNLIQPFRIQIANARKQRHPNVISWNMQCICQLFVLYILLMVALGFAISRMPPIHHVSNDGLFFTYKFCSLVTGLWWKCSVPAIL